MQVSHQSGTRSWSSERQRPRVAAGSSWHRTCDGWPRAWNSSCRSISIGISNIIPHCASSLISTPSPAAAAAMGHSRRVPCSITFQQHRAGPATCIQASNRVEVSTAPVTPAAAAAVSTTTAPAAAGMDMRPPILRVRDLSFHPAGVPAPLLSGINMDVPPNSLGLVIGRSGSGKTTLLQILAGLCDQTSGSVYVGRPGPRIGLPSSLAPPTSSAASTNGRSGSAGGAGASPRGSKFAARMAAENRTVPPPSPGPPPTTPPSSPSPSPAASLSSSPSGAAGSPPSTPGVLAAAAQPGGLAGAEPLSEASMEERMLRVGLVFQFPERHFLGGDVFNELTFSWPRNPEFFLEQHALRTRVMQVLQAVRLSDIDLRLSPRDLSGGQQRRLALAIQLIRQPAVLLLDEPLAGLDWQARQEVVELLQRLKKECTLIVVSHDLVEVSPLVDRAWVMKTGGTLEALPSWPPPAGTTSSVEA